MGFISVPSIFWITLLSVFLILSVATIIGRAYSGLFPNHLRNPVRFYLAPVLGLSTLTILATFLGRILPLGNSTFGTVSVTVVIVIAVALEKNVIQAFKQIFQVSFFGIVCGTGILAALWVTGTLNTANDSFTYLAHSNWLQTHAFNFKINPDLVTPLDTQVFLYQREGFRMGGSFLLALCQGMLHLQWSFDAYPAVIISVIGACCLAIGFPLANSLQFLSLPIRFALLTLPAFTLGGLVFGAYFGFMPQTIGLSMGSALLFLVGASLHWVVTHDASNKEIFKAVLPSAILFSATVFAYSELAPFLFLAILGSCFILIVIHRSVSKPLIYLLTLIGISGLLLNTELVRAFLALKTQSAVVVGSPVDWPLLGFFAHAFGIHGGAWDWYQWTLPGKVSATFFLIGITLLCILVLMLMLSYRIILTKFLNVELLPVALVIIGFLILLIYYRYFVQSPFSTGIGQSWSQFKLTDWTYPFLMTLVLTGVIQFRQSLGKYFDYLVITLFVVSIVFSGLTGIKRSQSLMHQFEGISDLSQFYEEYRNKILTSCPSNKPVYFALSNTGYVKFREMAIYFLPERETKSDWTDDGMIISFIPTEKKRQLPNLGDCVVELNESGSLLGKEASVVGPLKIGVFNGGIQYHISSVTGAYDKESDKDNWWRWVEQKVVFQFQPIFVPDGVSKAKLKFEYATRGKQTLKGQIRSNGKVQEFFINSDGKQMSFFEVLIEVPQNNEIEISIESDGLASLLGEKDSRKTTWIIRNVVIASISP